MNKHHSYTNNNVWLSASLYSWYLSKRRRSSITAAGTNPQTIQKYPPNINEILPLQMQKIAGSVIDSYTALQLPCSFKD